MSENTGSHGFVAAGLDAIVDVPPVTKQISYWLKRERPCGRVRLFLFALANMADIDPRADIYYPQRIVLEPGVRIGPRAMLNFRSGRQELRADRPWNIRLGEGTKVMPDAKLIPQQGFIDIGAHCTVQYGCVLYGVGGLTIGDHTRIAAGTIIMPMSHSFSDLTRPIWHQPETAKGITIGRDCWIGAGVRITDGVSIGDGCVIGAGSVVTRDLPEYSIAVGVPARVVESRVLRSSRAR